MLVAVNDGVVRARQSSLQSLRDQNKTNTTTKSIPNEQKEKRVSEAGPAARGTGRPPGNVEPAPRPAPRPGAVRGAGRGAGWPRVTLGPTCLWSAG